MNKSEYKTYYSGSKIASAIILTLGVLCISLFWSLVDTLEEKLIISGIWAMLVAFFILALGYGMRSLTVTRDSVVLRNFIFKKTFPIQSIEGIRSKVLENSSQSAGVQPIHLIIAYKEGEQIKFASTPHMPLVFGRKIFEFIKDILMIRPDTPIYSKSFGGSLKSNQISPVNATDQFPIQRDPFRPVLKKLGLIPEFNEATLFIMGLSFFFVLFTNFSIWEDIGKVLELSSDARNRGKLGTFVLFIFIGAVHSIFHGLSSSKKSSRSKYFMLVFGIGMTAGTSIGIGFHTWKDLNWLYSIPILWNLVYGFGLLFTFSKYTSTNSVSDKNARLHEILIGLIAIGGIIYYGQIKLDAYWAYVYSACIAYATALNRHASNLWMLAEKRYDLPTMKIPPRYHVFFKWLELTDPKIGWSFAIAIMVGFLGGPALLLMGSCSFPFSTDSCVPNETLTFISRILSWPFYSFSGLSQGMFVYFGILGLWVYYYTLISITLALYPRKLSSLGIDKNQSIKSQA